MPVVDASEFPSLHAPPTKVTLLDGGTVHLLGGDQFPLDMPADFHVVLVPHTFLPAIDEDVFVLTNLLELREAVALAKSSIGAARRALKVSKAQVHDTLRRGLGPLHDAVHAGDAGAQERWTSFCDDCVSVAVTLAAMGRELQVMTKRPQVLKIDGVIHVMGPIFKLRL
jgi:hypothetical protein